MRLYFKEREAMRAMIRIAVCDDNEIIAIGMRAAITNHDFGTEITVDAFTSGRDLYESFAKKKYNIVLLDIELDEDVSETVDGSGMFLSNKLKQHYPELLVIFFTGVIGYERKLLNFEPFRYINKPITDEELFKVVGDAVDRLLGWETKYFKFKTSGINISVNIDEIIYFSSQYPNVTIHCIDDDNTDFRDSMDSVEIRIRELSNDFIRVSKSFLVNKNYIKSNTSKEVHMKNGDVISIPQKRQKKFFK